MREMMGNETTDMMMAYANSMMDVMEESDLFINGMVFVVVFFSNN